MILCAIIASKLIWSSGKRQHVSCVRSLRIWIILLFSLKMQSHPNLTSETEEKLMLYLSVKIGTRLGRGMMVSKSLKKTRPTCVKEFWRRE